MRVDYKRKYVLTGPDKFDELTGDQLLFFADCYAQILRRETLKRVSYKFTKDPSNVYLKIPLIARLQIEDTYDWLFEVFTSRKNLISEFSHNGKTYYGYSDNLENVLVGEWMIADGALRSYQQTKEESQLNKFIAVLYRPKREDGITYGDLRRPFDEFQCVALEREMSTIPRKYKVAIMLNYSGMRHQIVLDCPHIFKEKSEGKNFGVPGMIHDMSGPELGTVTQIEKEYNIRNLLFFAEKNEIRKVEKKAPAA